MLGDEGGGAEREVEEEDSRVRGAAAAMMRRKEKRKAMKKEKRRLSRRVRAVKAREEESARMNDIEETIRIEEAERDEAAAREKAIIEFEEREKAWAERKKKMKEEEEEEKEELETKEKLNHAQRDEVKADDENDGWECVEEGPAEIIWKGNEIIVKKKKMRVQKKDGDRPKAKEDTYLPTSNPLPPQSEAFADYNSSLVVSAQQLLENVASQVPNFGTEQDKAHCPFHLKTGACRFGQRCSRVHFYPDKSCTLLIRNMYNGPGLTLEQDEGLEYTDEETEHCYEEFYEDVHTEFLKFGELENFKVCKNGSFHLRGNVYVHYKSVDSAILAYHSLKGRYFAGKQVNCEFVNVSRWKVAICGEYMKSRYKTCSHGTACNFIHCFHNPGGDYEWADWEKPPPRYWIKKMVALFGHCEGYDEEEWIAPGKSSHQLRKSPRLRRFRSREKDCSFKGKSRGSYVKEDSIKSWRNHHKGRNPSERGDYVNQRGHHSRGTAAGGNDEDARPVDQEKDGRASHSHKRRNVKRTRHRDSESDEDNMYKLDESLEKEDSPGHSSCRSLKYRKKGRREEYSKGSAHGSEVTYVDDPDKHRSMRHGNKSRDPGYHDSDIEDRWDPGRYSLEALVEKH